eukprot:CAMPEP_0203822730 /NCGR_PEP_ID=MMETSP0115-20131106/47097_1 /ASSEMBLY_ACC=CAM_ASM_000227 /TAXON_ID=33651 /ORGANISM="Bicosoecid sp, Strain ms1" /LENGTH=135 /DNA_ID=CAMNT_0050731765 /DNA_START=176 /DNA_END=579 /DNA_ORIENTATION=+
MSTPLTTDPKLVRSFTETSETIKGLRQAQIDASPHGKSLANLKASPPKVRRFKSELDKKLPKVDLNSPGSPGMDADSEAALARARALNASIAEFEAPDFSNLFAKAAALNDKYADVLDDSVGSGGSGTPSPKRKG